MLGLLCAAAIVFSAVAYSLGSVVARPLTKTTNATFLSGLTMLPGGLILKLTRFRGHRTVWVQGVHDGQDEIALRT